MRIADPSARSPLAPTGERRRRRADHATHATQALRYQLAACCEAGGIRGMVIADEDGLPLAASGDIAACDEIAATMRKIAARTPSFTGTLLGGGQMWDVAMTRVVVDHSELMVCAVGGSAEQRQQQIARGAEGARRILRA